jgi:hypothetical protein
MPVNGQVVLSPARDLIWSQEGSSQGSTAVARRTAAGFPEAARIELSANVWLAGATADGVLVQSSGGGVYEIGPDGGAHQRAAGAFLAAGAHHLVAFECDAVLRCGYVVHDDAGAVVETVPVADDEVPTGLARLSPDGRWLALLRAAGQGVTLVDLETGATSDPDIRLGMFVVAWSPDGRFLLAVDADDDVVAIEAATGARHVLDLSPLEGVQGLDLRPAGTGT